MELYSYQQYITSRYIAERCNAMHRAINRPTILFSLYVIATSVQHLLGHWYAAREIVACNRVVNKLASAMSVATCTLK